MGIQLILDDVTCYTAELHYAVGGCFCFQCIFSHTVFILQNKKGVGKIACNNMYKHVLNNWIVESTLLLLSLKNIFIFFLTIISLLLWDYV